MELCYSADGEYFDDDLQSVIDSVAYNNDVEYGDEATLGELTVEVGEVVRAQHISFIDTGDIIERMQERAYDEHGEFAETYLDNITEDSVMQLDQLLKDWCESLPAPSFYSVKNVKSIKIKELL